MFNYEFNHSQLQNHVIQKSNLIIQILYNILTPGSYVSHLIPLIYTYLKNISHVKLINSVIIVYHVVKSMEKTLRWEEEEGENIKYIITKKDEHTIEFERLLLGEVKDQYAKDVWEIRKIDNKIIVTVKDVRMNWYEKDNTCDEIVTKIEYTTTTGTADFYDFFFKPENIDWAVKMYGVKTAMRKVLEELAEGMREDLNIDYLQSDDC